MPENSVADERLCMESGMIGGETADVSSSDHTPTKRPCRWIWVGTGGTVKVTTGDGSVLDYPNVQAGTLLPFVDVALIWNAGTNASNIRCGW